MGCFRPLGQHFGQHFLARPERAFLRRSPLTVVLPAAQPDHPRITDAGELFGTMACIATDHFHDDADLLIATGSKRGSVDLAPEFGVCAVAFCISPLMRDI